MIVPDVNLLVYAYNRDAPHHANAKTWWEDLLSSDVPVALPWVSVLGFVRLMTHRAVLTTPLVPAQAIDHTRRWMMRPNVEPLEPGARHLDILDHLLSAVGAGGNLTTDAHLAALAIEYQAELCSNDTDFARFPGLRWRDPLQSG